MQEKRPISILTITINSWEAVQEQWAGHVTIEVSEWASVNYGEVIERTLENATELSSFLEKVTSLDSTTADLNEGLARELEKVKVGFF